MVVLVIPVMNARVVTLFRRLQLAVKILADPGMLCEKAMLGGVPLGSRYRKSVFAADFANCIDQAVTAWSLGLS